MSIKIREAVMADVGELIELLYDLFSIEKDFIFNKEKQFQGLQLMLQDSRARRIWVAESGDGRVVGMCTLQVLISTAEGGEVGLIEDLVVNKQFHCQGIGRLLIETVETWSRAQNLLRLQLLTDQTNLAAIRFYNHLKWQPTQMICMRKLNF